MSSYIILVQETYKHTYWLNILLLICAFHPSNGSNLIFREDVWNFAPNLVHVKPYHFFKHTGDINAPPGLGKHEQERKLMINYSGSSRKV